MKLIEFTFPLLYDFLELIGKDIEKMSLGENLQFLRKRNELTQEDLAEKLEVSRQSVSKWESDTVYPEMDKLIQLSQMFHVKLDDLIQKDVSTLYVEDKADYDRHMNLFSKMIALGVGLILFGISFMQFLEGILIGIGITAGEDIGNTVFLIFVVVAVAIFIIMGLQHSNFERKNPYIENFYSEEELDFFHKKYTIMITSGVVMILIGVILTSGADAVCSEIFGDIPVSFEYYSGSVFFFLLTIAVSLFVYAGMQKEKYDIDEYNRKHDKESEGYKMSQIKGTISACIMMTALIVYLILGFVFDLWGVPSIVLFPAAGIGCGIACLIVDAKHKR